MFLMNLQNHRNLVHLNTIHYTKRNSKSRISLIFAVKLKKLYAYSAKL